MVRIDDVAASVFEVQSALRALSTLNGAVRPRLVPDGIYGEETSAAVRAFQVWKSLPETGVVDFVTWQAIFAAPLTPSAQK